MPFYDYFCQANNTTVEVYHPLGKRLKTWGEVCQSRGMAAGKTPLSAPVIRLVGGVTPVVFRVKGLDKDEPSKKFSP